MVPVPLDVLGLPPRVAMRANCSYVMAMLRKTCLICWSEMLSASRLRCSARHASRCFPASSASGATL